jgi:hypothetical protein
MFSRGEEMVSTQTSEKDGTPMLSLKKVSTNEYSVTSMSLECCESVLRMAGDQKLMEVRSCLEGNIQLFQD